MRLILVLFALALPASALAQPIRPEGPGQPTIRPAGEAKTSPRMYSAGIAAFLDAAIPWAQMSAPGFTLAEATAGRAPSVDPQITAFTEGGGHWEISTKADDVTGGDGARWPAGQAQCTALHRAEGERNTGTAAGLGFVRAGTTATCQTRAETAAGEIYVRVQTWLMADDKAYRLTTVALVRGGQAQARNEIAALLEREMAHWGEEWTRAARRPG